VRPGWKPAADAFREAARAARANFIPGLILQGFLVAFLAVYAGSETARAALADVAVLKREAGYAFAFVGYVFASALLPEVLRVAVFQGFRPGWENLRRFLYSAPFWGCFGMLVDLLYRVQILLFGNDSGLLTIALKVVFDQFVFSPFLGTPLLVVYFAWVDGERLRDVLAPAEFFRRVVRIQCAGWMVWIPGVALIYWMPALLQIPVAILISAFWVLVFTAVRERQAHRKA